MEKTSVRGETPWRLFAKKCCGTHVYLTKEEYIGQLRRPDSLWMCPIHGEAAMFDDDWYESHLEDDDPDDDPKEAA